MNEIQQKLLWLLCILPGFVSFLIISSIVDFGDTGEFLLAMYSLALTLINVTIALLVFWAFGGKIEGTTTTTTQFVSFSGITLIVSIIVGILSGIAVERGWFYALVRELPFVDVLNKRSAFRPLTFILSQNTGGQLDRSGDGRPSGQKVGEAWIRVYLEGGAVFEGWPEFYASKPSEVYLSPACRVSESDQGTNATKVAGPGVFVPETRIMYALLLDRASSPCYVQWSQPAAVSKPRR